MLPDIDDVRDAAARIERVVRKTPLISHPVLDEIAGAPVYLKCESLQITGSFKLRGAYNRLAQLTAEEKKAGVVAFSSGNHAQGVARAARQLGIPAVIVMPSDTPAIKIDGVNRDGAEIVYYDRFTESREEIAAKLIDERGGVLVPSFDDRHIIAGQGTSGLEIIDQWPDTNMPHQLVCGIGGGGLISGISLAMHDNWPRLKIIGVEPEGFDDFARSLASGSLESNSPDARSICDALLTKTPGNLTYDICRQHLSSVVRVSDEEAREAVRFGFRHFKLVLEPGGCVSLAALLAGKIDVKPGLPVILMLTGGNVDPGAYAGILAG